jgi:hypothetical protein
MKKSYGVGDQPFQPSRMKIHEFSYDAVAVDPLTGYGPSIGFDVSKWQAILLSVGSPALQAGWKATIRIWRYKQRANLDWSPSGFWYASEEVTVSLDGNVSAAGGGPMEYVFSTLQSEKMYFQLVSVANEPAVAWEIVLGAYGLVPRVNPNTGEAFYEGAAASASASASASIEGCPCAEEFVTEELVELDPFAGGPFTDYVLMDGYRHYSIQVSIIAQTGLADTITIGCDGSNQLGGAPAAFGADDWSPMNDLVFDTAAAGTVLTNALLDLNSFYFGDTNLSLRYFRFITTRTATAGGDTRVNLRIKKWY